jgi:hypothetical protein
MRDFIIGDYIIYTLVEVHFVVKGVVIGIDDKCLSIKSDDNGLYKDYKNKFELDHQKNRNKRINIILE